MLKVNKNSSAYFISFFMLIVFGFIVLLQFTHDKLEARIQQQAQLQLTNSLQAILPCDNFIKSNLENKEVFYCHNDDKVALHLFTDKAYADKIEYIAYVNFNGIIKDIAILNHKETPGLGDKITDIKWLSSLINIPLEMLKIKPDGGQIDTFAAASVTPRALLNNLQANAIWVKQNSAQLKTTIEN